MPTLIDLWNLLKIWKLYAILSRKSKPPSKRGSQKELLITYGKPHKPVSRNSVGRWIKNELMNLGVDTTVLMPHSCRSLSVSKAKVNGILKSVLLEKGCWEKESTYKKCYYKDKINRKIQAAEVNYVTHLILE